MRHLHSRCCRRYWLFVLHCRVYSAHLALRYTDDISIPFWDQQPQLIHHVRHTSLHKSTAKERAMRDLYFENRRKYL